MKSKPTFSKARSHLFVDRSDAESFQFKLVQVSVLVFLSLALPIAAFTLMKHFYYGAPWIEIFSFRSDDMPGYVSVDQNTQSFGVHYFGDYLLASAWSELDNPWLAENPVNYPPLALLFFRLFSFFEYKLGLVLFQIGMFVCMIAPIWISLRSRALLIRFGSVLIFGILSAPIIIAIDRGNIIGYLGIVLYFFAVSVLNKSWHIASVFGAIAVSIKLFPVVIFAVFLIYGKWKHLLLGMLYSMFLVVGLLSTFPGKITDTLSGFWSGFAMFRNVDPNLLYCGNQSLIGGLLSWLDKFGMIGLSQFIIENTLFIGGFLSILILSLMVKYKNEVWLVLVLSLSIITAAPALVYSYTMIWVLPALAIVFLASNFDFLRISTNFNSEKDGKQRNRLYFVTTVYLTILLVPYPIQWHHQLSLLCTSSVYHVIYFTATCFWIGFLFANKLGREANRVQLS